MSRMQLAVFGFRIARRIRTGEETIPVVNNGVTSLLISPIFTTRPSNLFGNSHSNRTARESLWNFLNLSAYLSMRYTRHSAQTLCTSKVDMQEAKDDAKKKAEKERAENKKVKKKVKNEEQKREVNFNEKNRRAGRELLGMTQRSPSLRPLVCRRAIFGLTGTPLLDSSSRVVELANLMGGVYVAGLSSHWRKLERESCRDMFLHSYLEPMRSREVRQMMYSKCQDYLDVACCRNKTGEEMKHITLKEHTQEVKMTNDEKVSYLKSQSGISKPSLAVGPDDFNESLEHDIRKFLKQNAELQCRGAELVWICKGILGKDKRTKIVVFADGAIGGAEAARGALESSDLGCTFLEDEDSVQLKNKKIAWYQHADETPEDEQRPRVLVLHFEHAAGLNMQYQCYNLVLFTPVYVGKGGALSDPVADTSTELQAIGRVYRMGQPQKQVNVYRIEVRGPEGEECLDGFLIRRNTDKETIDQATNVGDD